VKVDATFGSSGGSEELPTADVLTELAKELEKPANWNAQKPENGRQLVTLRDPNAGSDNGPQSSGPLLAHPLGTLGVRQQVVPLDVLIEKYGNAKPKHQRFALSDLEITGSAENLSGQTELREKFAPAKFEQMSDKEKMEAEPFERLPAGRTVENGIVHYAGSEDASLLSWATLEYEASVVDEENEDYWTDPDAIDDTWDTRLELAFSSELAEQSAVATAATRTSGEAAYRTDDASKRVGVGDQQFVVVQRSDLSRVEFDGNPKTGQTRVEARDAMRQYAATHDASRDDLQVVGVQEVGGTGGGGS
jgi:hypothetical protein